MTLMSVAPVPDWLFPPEGGFEAADLDRLPDLPPHSELIDGSLILVSPQAHLHTLILFVLETALRRRVPGNLRVRREITVTLGKRQRPEPDLTVFEAAEQTALTGTTIDADKAVLVVEVVSPESRTRDRKRKPVLYAEAGIQHFWLVETEDGKPVLYTYELDPVTKEYAATGIQRGDFALNVPYPIEIDFGEIERL